MKKQTKKTNVQYRPPIVTLMGHVDHGKTSILDAIRESGITKTEAGGITQHIGAYTVVKDGKKITFIDTPGHEAFTKMRARGGAAADIVILVVAADDGVMPQTKEAIMHAKSANVPIIVAINKIDLEGADILRVKRQLAENGIAVEGFGGNVVAAPISATKGTGINELLDLVNLVAEMNQDVLVASSDDSMQFLVIESSHKGKSGVVVSGIVKNGTLHIRDNVESKEVKAKVKAIKDSSGNRIDFALPGDAVEILGFTDMPEVGDIVHIEGVELEKVQDPKEVAEGSLVVAESVEDGGGEIAKPKKILNLVIRADTVGTLEAIVASVGKLNVEDASTNILFSGTGEVKESDILLASTGRAVVVAFKVKVSSSVEEMAKTQKIIIRSHEIIYEMLEELEGALVGVLEIEEAKVKGNGIIIEKFVLPKSNMVVAGTLVEAGKFKVNNRVGIFRDNSETPVFIARIKTLHIGTKEVDIAKKGDEVGILFKPELNQIELDDKIIVL